MFDYATIIKAENPIHATQLLREHQGSRFIAGGTDILVALRHAALHKPEHRPQTLIDIHNLPECKGIYLDDKDILHLGAGTTFTDLITNPLIAAHAPVLAEAAQNMAGPQIRNVATLGGNICNGAVSADSIPPLLILDARLQFVDSDKTTTRPLLGFHTGPGKVDLDGQTILMHILLDTKALQNMGTATYKYATRAAMDIATIICSAAVKLDGNTITELRLAYGVAAPIPIRCTNAEKYAQGKEADSKTFEEIARITASQDVSPRSSWRAEKTFRLHIIETLAYRMIEKATEKARGKHAN